MHPTAGIQMKYQNIVTHLPAGNCLYMIKYQLNNIGTKFCRTEKTNNRVQEQL